MPTEKKPCEACGGRGWILSLNTDRDVYEIQRCDTCFRFQSDREAGETAAATIEEALSGVPVDRLWQAKFQSIDFEESTVTFHIPEPVRDAFHWHAGEVVLNVNPITTPR